MKDLFIQAHDELIEEYLELHPDSSEDEAYKATLDKIQERYTNKFADLVDRAHEQAKERLYEQAT